MSIKVSYSTMGQSSPATVAEDAGRTGGYLYKGDPKRTPVCPEYVPLAEREPGTADGTSELHPANAKAMAARKERLSRYTALRRDGKGPAEAAELTGLSASAGRQYEQEFKRQQEGAGNE